MICGTPLSNAFMSCGFLAPGSERSDGLPRRDASCGLAGLTPGRPADGETVGWLRGRKAGTGPPVLFGPFTCEPGTAEEPAPLGCCCDAAFDPVAPVDAALRRCCPLLAAAAARRYRRHRRRLGRGPGRRKEPGSQRSRRDASWPFSISQWRDNGVPGNSVPARLTLDRIRKTCRTRAAPRAASGSRWPCASCRRSRSPCRRTASRSPAVSGNRRRCRRAAPRPPAGRCRGRSRGRGTPAHGCSRRDRPIGRGRAGGRW